MARAAFAAEGDAILLVGAPPSWGAHLAQSIYMRDIHGRTDGPPPPVDLAREKLVGDFVRALIRQGAATAVHDVSDGGLSVALAEMAMASGIGATVSLPYPTDPIPVWFGEDQARYLVTVPSADKELLRDIVEEALSHGFAAPIIGTTGGAELKLGMARAIPVSELKAAHESWFPRFMDGKAAETA
ncbi:AIR synthase-related protein [Mesorhizobium sp. ZMM04-4]